MDLKRMSEAELAHLDREILRMIEERRMEEARYIESLSTDELEDLRVEIWEELTDRETQEVEETAETADQV